MYAERLSSHPKIVHVCLRRQRERKGKPYVRAKDKAEMREEDDNTGKEEKQYNERSKIGM